METIPTLTSSGWLSDLDEGGSRLLSYFVTSDGYRSTEYQGSVKSLAYLIAVHGENQRELEEAITTALLELYRGYYESAEVTVKLQNNSGEWNIDISLQYAKDNFVKDLNRSIRVNNESIITILGNDNV